ncbi:MAG TPA: DNA polymerase III subunit chi [Stellaceae bacterium]|jgi:DNA polymerase-3 subunit chi|nr:DNA polymerase III subunit chi [Stellaceae bacterium]
MTEIGFYHLLATPLERALPKLLERGLAAGFRIVVLADSAERVEHLDAALWTYDDASFLPHGSRRDGRPERQPVWLTDSDENPNQADMLVLTDGASSTHLDSYRRCLDLFDGNDEVALAAARERWRRAKEAGHALTYWQQTATGWAKKE